MKRVLAVVPVRGTSSAKTRLAPIFLEDERRMLVWAMLRRLTRKILQSGVVDQTVIVTRDAAAVREQVTCGEYLTVLEQSHAGLNGALKDARDWADRHGFDVMVVLPGDLPMIGAEDIRALACEPGPLVAAPDRLREGTNALKIDLEAWRTTPFHFRMGPGSFVHHIEEAERAGHGAREIALPGVAHDLDLPDDWADLSPTHQRQLREDIHRSLGVAENLT